MGFRKKSTNQKNNMNSKSSNHKQNCQPAEELQLFLSVETVAKILDCSEQFLRNLIRDRRIGYVKVGRLVRIPKNELIQFIQAYPSLETEFSKQLKKF